MARGQASKKTRRQPRPETPVKDHLQRKVAERKSSPPSNDVKTSPALASATVIAGNTIQPSATGAVDSRLTGSAQGGDLLRDTSHISISHNDPTMVHKSYGNWNDEVDPWIDPFNASFPRLNVCERYRAEDTSHIASLQTTSSNADSPKFPSVNDLYSRAYPGQESGANDKRDSMFSTPIEEVNNKESEGTSTKRASRHIPATRSTFTSWWPCRTYRWLRMFVESVIEGFRGRYRNDFVITFGVLVVCLWLAYTTLGFIFTGLIKGVNAQGDLGANCSVVYVTLPGPIITVSLIAASPTNSAQGTYYYSVINGTTEWLDSITPPARTSTATSGPLISLIASSSALGGPIGSSSNLPSTFVQQSPLTSFPVTGAVTVATTFTSDNNLISTVASLPSTMALASIPLNPSSPGGLPTMSNSIIQSPQSPPSATISNTVPTPLPSETYIVVTTSSPDLSTGTSHASPSTELTTPSPSAVVSTISLFPSTTVLSTTTVTLPGGRTTTVTLTSTSLPDTGSVSDSLSRLIPSRTLASTSSLAEGQTTTLATSSAIAITGMSSVSITPPTPSLLSNTPPLSTSPLSTSMPGSSSSTARLSSFLSSTGVKSASSGLLSTPSMTLTSTPTLTSSDKISPPIRSSSVLSNEPASSVLTSVAISPSLVTTLSQSSSATSSTASLSSYSLPFGTSATSTTSTSSSSTISGIFSKPNSPSIMGSSSTTVSIPIPSSLSSLSHTSGIITATPPYTNTSSSILNPPQSSSSSKSVSASSSSSTALPTLTSSEYYSASVSSMGLNSTSKIPSSSISSATLSFTTSPSLSSSTSSLTSKSSLPTPSAVPSPPGVPFSNRSSVTPSTTISDTLTSSVPRTISPVVTTSARGLGSNVNTEMQARALMTRIVSYGATSVVFVFPTPSIVTTRTFWTGTYPTVTGPEPSDLQTLPLTTRSIRQTPLSGLPSFQLLTTSNFKTAFNKVGRAAAIPTDSNGPALAEPTHCGESGNFTLSFDDTTVGPNESELLVVYGLKNPYHHLFYANGFTYVPDKWEPYPAISQPNVALFLPSSGRLLPNTPFAGTLLPGELGAGPRASVTAYWFNAFSAYFGCALSGLTPCLLRISGYRYDTVLRQEVLVAEQNVTLPAC